MCVLLSRKGHHYCTHNAKHTKTGKTYRKIGGTSDSTTYSAKNERNVNGAEFVPWIPVHDMKRSKQEVARVVYYSR